MGLDRKTAINWSDPCIYDFIGGGPSSHVCAASFCAYLPDRQWTGVRFELPSRPEPSQPLGGGFGSWGGGASRNWGCCLGFCLRAGTSKHERKPLRSFGCDWMQPARCTRQIAATNTFRLHAVVTVLYTFYRT